MVLECTGECLRTDTKYKDIFSRERMSYNKGSKCRMCHIWIKKPSFTKMDLDIVWEPEANTRYYDIKGKEQQTISLVKHIAEFPEEVICPCCGSEAEGKKLAQSKLEYEVLDELDEKGNQKTKPLGYVKTYPPSRPNYEKSYKLHAQELGIEDKALSINGWKRELINKKHDHLMRQLEIEISKPNRDESKILALKDSIMKVAHKKVKLSDKTKIDDWFLSLHDNYDNYEYVIEQLRERGFRLSDESFETRLDEMIKLLDKFDDKKRAYYVKIITKKIIKFAKDKAERDEIRGSINLNEYRAMIERKVARGEKLEYGPIVDIITEDEYEHQDQDQNKNAVKDLKR